LTALIYAAREGCQDCAAALLAAGADIDLADDGGTSPLLTAITNKHFDTAKFLVEAGANVDKWSVRGENPVYSAVDMNTLPHGGYPDRPSTDHTSAIEMLKILLDHGANPNLQLKLQPIYRSLKDDRGADSMLSVGATPLLRAAKAFDLDSMKLLIEHGARLDLPNRNGITPVMAAAGLGSSSIDTRGTYTVPDVGERSKTAVQYLVEHGADIDATDQYGRTALHGAAGWGWDEPVEYLVAQGADPTVQAKGGMTPLDSANGKSISRFGRGGGGDKHPDTIKLLERLIQDQQGKAKPGVCSFSP
jgi:ankyrin repeat protein